MSFTFCGLFNKVQSQIQDLSLLFNFFLFSYMYTSTLNSPHFGYLEMISNELEREECSSVSTAFVLNFDTWL